MPDTTTVQERVLEAVKVSQDATLKAYRTWAETTAALMPSATDVFSMEKAESTFGFAEKMWASQRDFFVKLCETAAPMSQAGPETARRTATSKP